MNAIRHTTFGIDAAGNFDRTSGSLPTSVAQSLAPLRITITAGFDHRLAARLLRRLAD